MLSPTQSNSASLRITKDILGAARRQTDMKHDWLPSERPSLGKRALRLVSYLITFCIGVAATILAWQFNDDADRETIANSSPQLGRLAPPAAPLAQAAPDKIAPAAQTAPDRQRLEAMSLDLTAMRQSVKHLAVSLEQTIRSVEQLAGGQAQMTRTVDQLAGGQAQMTRTVEQLAGGQAQMTHSVDQLAGGQAQMTRTVEQLAGGQAQMTRTVDQLAAGQEQVKPASGMTVESRADGASLRPTVRLNAKPTEARPPQTLPERGKQLSAESGHDPSCFPSPSAVLQNHPEGWPSWTLKAPGHEGTRCWYAATRTRASDQTGDDAKGKR
jgi:hypothetical protein